MSQARDTKIEEVAELIQEEVDKVNTNIFVHAKLNNFQIWVPLKANNVRSQIFNFSFMSELQFIREFDMKKIDFQARDDFSFNINNLVISMLNLIEKEEKIEQVTVSNILDPCRIQLKMDSLAQIKGENKDQKLDVMIEPLYLRIGFKHVDFANVVMSQVNETLNYITKLQQPPLPPQKQIEESKEAQ